MTPGVAPITFREDAAARRWLAARAMRVPLVLLKFGSPVLTIAALALIVRQPNLAEQPLHVRWALALPFALPFLLGAIHPLLRWLPQEWTLDADGIAGRGRANVRVPWTAIATWRVEAPAGLPTHVRVVFRRMPAWRHRARSMIVPSAARADVEARFARVGARDGARSGRSGERTGQ